MEPAPTSSADPMADDSLVYVLIPVSDFQLPCGFCGSSM
jgi:hypothetical protein